MKLTVAPRQDSVEVYINSVGDVAIYQDRTDDECDCVSLSPLFVPRLIECLQQLVGNDGVGVVSLSESKDRYMKQVSRT
jgi:hypothetical protein